MRGCQNLEVEGVVVAVAGGAPQTDEEVNKHTVGCRDQKRRLSRVVDN